MKTNFFFAALAVASMPLFSSCENESGDTTKPSIELVNPADGSTIYVGDPENCLHIKFADDVELGSWAVEVHNNFNEHSHTKSDDHHHDYTDEEIANAYVLKKQTFKFDAGLRNTSIDIDDLLVVGNGATPGSYHLGIYCIDAAGNQSEAWSKITIAEE